MGGGSAGDGGGKIGATGCVLDIDNLTKICVPLSEGGDGLNAGEDACEAIKAIEQTPACEWALLGGKCNPSKEDVAIACSKVTGIGDLSAEEVCGGYNGCKWVK